MAATDYIVLFKSVSENEDEDAYSSTFISAGFNVNLVPVLDFEFVNLDELLVKLKNPHDYEGIIFTSPRCVTGVQQSVEGNDEAVLEKWQNHKHFAVGEKTAKLVEDLKLSVDGKEAGNAKKLAEIMSKGQYEKPFLYPKGSLTKDTFKLDLKEKNISVDDVLIYQTKPHPELETKIKNIKIPDLNSVIYFVYFSPSGLNFTLPLLQKYQFDLDKVKFIAIGPTTEGALQQNGLKVAAISSKPEPKALLEAVLSCKNSD